MSESRTEVGADAAALAPLQSFLLEFWSNCQLPPATLFPFELALEEVFMNVVMHGSRDRPDVRAEFTLRHEDSWVELTIRDNGAPFDPLAAPEPDVTAPLEDRPIGGLGVHLIRTLMDAVSYALVDGRNVLVLRKHLDAEPN